MNPFAAARWLAVISGCLGLIGIGLVAFGYGRMGIASVWLGLAALACGIAVLHRSAPETAAPSVTTPDQPSVDTRLPHLTGDGR